MKKSNLQRKRQVIFDHDGSADDFLSLILVLSMKNVNVLGISITPADCYLENAIDTTLKILSLVKKNNVDIGLGKFYGVNAFPADWRAKPKILNALPNLINIDTSFDISSFEDSTDLIVQKISSSDAPITIVMTGPCSNLVQAIEKNPSITNNIEEVIWMGGAIDVPGNVKTYNHDGTAEWNVYWDPNSSNKLLKYKLPLTIVPLDTTNAVPVTIDFLKRLALQSAYLYSNLASQFWATTIDTIPSYEYIYFMWDVLATSYLAIPEAFMIEEVELEISSTGPNAGQTYRKPGSDQWVRIAKNVRKEYFYNYLLDQLKHDP